MMYGTPPGIFSVFSGAVRYEVCDMFDDIFSVALCLHRQLVSLGHDPANEKVL
jgi:hypothetical protein